MSSARRRYKYCSARRNISFSEYLSVIPDEEHCIVGMAELQVLSHSNISHAVEQRIFCAMAPREMFG